MQKSLKILILLAIALASTNGLAALRLQNTITGITGPALENAQNQLNAQQAPHAGTLTIPQIQRFYEETPKTIKQAIEPYGYFRAKVASTLIRNGEAWTVHSRVIPKQPLRITRLDLRITGEGAHDPRFRRLMQRFPLKKGRVLKIARYNKAKDRLFDLASRRGYLAAKMEKSEIQIDRARYTARVILHFDTGPRYHFGLIRFSKTPFNICFLRRFLTFKEGEHYSDQKLQRLQEDLINSNYFQSVVVQPKHDRARNRAVPIHVRLRPKKSQHYIIGGGYGTDTGFRGQLGIELRRLTPTGHYFYGTATGSLSQSELNAHYIIPGRHPATDRYDLSAAIIHLDQHYGKSTAERLALSCITKKRGWQRTISLALQNEKYTPTGQKTQSAIWLMPGVNWLRTVSDDPLRPKRGYRVNIIAQGASKAILAKEDFFQASIDAKGIYPITKSNRLIARGVFGYTAVKNLNTLPLTLQYYTGGTQSIRGYNYKSIGPGRILTVGSIELQHRLIGNWYASAFFDAGNAANNLTTNFKRGAGVGIVWQSPIGAIELTYAKALDDPGRPWRLQFTMGPEL